MSSAKPLTHDAVFRIEVSLSSRKSSAIVMRTTARLYSLQGSQPITSIPATGPADAEWRSVAYGAPCLQLMKENTELNSAFRIYIVIAEVESGISLWEQEVDAASNYHAMQANFHTFANGGQTYAIQFASEDEAGRMLKSLQDLLLQKQKAETVSFDAKPEEAVFKKPKNLRRLNKKDISTPCNFKHVSGITMQRTAVCEEELRGTIQRKIRSLSLSNLAQKRAKPRSKIPGEMTGGSIYTAGDVSPDIARRTEEKGKRPGGVLHKFGSLRLSKKKASKDSPPMETQFSHDDNRKTLPAHFRHSLQPRVVENTFTHPHGYPQGLSHSSDDIVDCPSSAHAHPSQIQRRYTTTEQHSPTRKSQFTYTPYAHAQSKVGYSGPDPGMASLTSRPYMSDMVLNRNMTAPVRLRDRGVGQPPGSVDEWEAIQMPRSRQPSSEQRAGERGRSFDNRWSWHPSMVEGRSTNGPTPHPSLRTGQQRSATLSASDLTNNLSRVPLPATAGIAQRPLSDSRPEWTAASGSPTSTLKDEEERTHASGLTSQQTPVPQASSQQTPGQITSGQIPQQQSPQHSAPDPAQQKRPAEPVITIRVGGAKEPKKSRKKSKKEKSKDKELKKSKGKSVDSATVQTDLSPAKRPLPPTPVEVQPPQLPDWGHQHPSQLHQHPSQLHQQVQHPSQLHQHPSQLHQHPLQHLQPNTKGYTAFNPHPPLSHPHPPHSHYPTSTSHPGHDLSHLSYSQGGQLQTQLSPSHSGVKVAPVTQPGVPQSLQPVPVSIPHPHPHTSALSPHSNSHHTPASAWVPPGEPPSASGTTVPFQQYTEQMMKALEQFDDLLAPQAKREISQTAL